MFAGGGLVRWEAVKANPEYAAKLRQLANRLALPREYVEQIR